MLWLTTTACWYCIFLEYAVFVARILISKCLKHMRLWQLLLLLLIRVISAVFLKANGRLAWGGLTISTRMCWLVDSTIALLTTVLHYPFSNMYSYLNSSLVYINAYSLNGNMWGRECPKLFFSMEGGIPHRDTPGTFLFLI